MVICPLHSKHYVPKDSLEKHMASCSWKMEGYHEQDVPLPEGCGAEESKILIGNSYLEYTLFNTCLSDVCQLQMHGLSVAVFQLAGRPFRRNDDYDVLLE